MKRAPRIYLSGLISNGGRIKDPRIMLANINSVKATRDALWLMGYHTFCPHSNDEAVHMRGVPYEHLLQYDLWIIGHHDCIYLMRNWKKSEGCIRERNRAVEKELVELHNLKEAERFITWWRKR